MTECREERYLVRHHQAGADGLLRIAPLFDFMQDAAALHADELGCGLDFLHRNRMLWVLSRIRVAIDRMPEIGETLRVLTYPTGTERLFALRQFTITDANGGALARATSCWLVLKAESYHPLRPESALERPLPLNEALPRHFSGLAKLPEVERDVMRMRYLDGMRWRDITRKFYYSSSYVVGDMHRRCKKHLAALIRADAPKAR